MTDDRAAAARERKAERVADQMIADGGWLILRKFVLQAGATGVKRAGRRKNRHAARRHDARPIEEERSKR
jgi:hypothetical protein